MPLVGRLATQQLCFSVVQLEGLCHRCLSSFDVSTMLVMPVNIPIDKSTLFRVLSRSAAFNRKAFIT